MNAKIVILIGNGLGKAIDPSYFSLETGLKNAFKRLDSEEQNLIDTLLGCEPSCEDDLLSLQYLKKAVDSLKGKNLHLRIANERMQTSSLTELPKIVSKFRNYTAKEFLVFSDQRNKWIKNGKWLELTNFLTYLAAFISSLGPNGSWKHVCLATLNYDNLLSFYYHHNDPNKLLSGGINAKLQDGFKGSNPTKFEKDSFEDGNRNHMGHYLHLHGSAIFANENNVVTKENVNKIGTSREDIKDINVEKNIVLGNREEKLNIIDDSPILKEYWRTFEKDVLRCQNLFIVGCSQNDNHISDLIEKRAIYFKDSQFNIFIISRFHEQSNLEGWKAYLKKLSPTEPEIIDPTDFTKDFLEEKNKKILVKMDNLLDFHWFQ